MTSATLGAAVRFAPALGLMLLLSATCSCQGKCATWGIRMEGAVVCPVQAEDVRAVVETFPSLDSFKSDASKTLPVQDARFTGTVRFDSYSTGCIACLREPHDVVIRLYQGDRIVDSIRLSAARDFKRDRNEMTYTLAEAVVLRCQP